MKFLALIYADETGYAEATPEDVAAVMEAYVAYENALREAGVSFSGEGLQPSVTATTVRVRDGERILTDGPFAETKEQVGGYYLFDCKDLDEALEWSARIPGAAEGTVEVRPVIDYAAYEVGAER